MSGAVFALAGKSSNKNTSHEGCDAAARGPRAVSPRIGSVGTVDTSQTVRFLEWPEAATLGVAVAVTTRHGGVSEGVHESLNLGLHVGDDPERGHRQTGTRRPCLRGRLGEPVVFAEQVHGASSDRRGPRRARPGHVADGRCHLLHGHPGHDRSRYDVGHSRRRLRPHGPARPRGTRAGRDPRRMARDSVPRPAAGHLTQWRRWGPSPSASSPSSARCAPGALRGGRSRLRRPRPRPSPRTNCRRGGSAGRGRALAGRPDGGESPATACWPESLPPTFSTAASRPPTTTTSAIGRHAHVDGLPSSPGSRSPPSADDPVVTTRPVA